MVIRWKSKRRQSPDNAMLMPGSLYAPTQVLPHAGAMCLLDRIEDYGSDWLCAGVDVNGRGMFEDADGRVPSWLGIEYMAQAVAAYAGIECLQNGKPVSIGMLIGSRKYDARVSHFETGWRLSVQVQLLMRDGDELAVFDCRLNRGEQLLAAGDVKAFRPADIDEFMRSKR
jgi:predicted hotdog family 3-hydroxylacyl-ACP dehydratase